MELISIRGDWPYQYRIGLGFECECDDLGWDSYKYALTQAQEPKPPSSIHKKKKKNSLTQAQEPKPPSSIHKKKTNSLTQAQGGIDHSHLQPTNCLFALKAVVRFTMVKLTLAREVQMYGSDPTRNIWEFINSYLYILATILLSCGFGLQLLSGQGEPIAKPSLIVILIGIVLVVAVNTYDLMAHMVGVSLVGLDTHMVLVQLAVPVVHAVGAVLTFIGILLTQTESRGNNKQDAAKVLVVGPLLWLFATLYEMCLCWKARDSKVDLRRKSVQVPFLMGTTLFIMGGHVYQMYLSGPQQDLETFPGQWLWLCTLGSSYFLMGGLHNLEYNMQQMN